MNSPTWACLFLLAFFAEPSSQFQTSIVLGNSNSQKAEAYTVTFDCTSSSCTPRPLQSKDLFWSSPAVVGLSEIKPIYYNGKKAVLMSTWNGAVVYEYPSNRVLFRKELTGYEINVHSVEALPDGNVLMAGSISGGVFAVLYPEGSKVNQSKSDTVLDYSAPFAHGAVYHKGTGLLFAGGYLTISVIKYESGSNRRGKLNVIKTISLKSYYDEPNKNEDANTEDGIHDMYQVDGEPDNIFVSTGEHVFTFNVRTYAITRHPTLYTIPSKNSRNNYNKVAVKDKGGVKAITKDAANGLFIAKPSPWFKEISNYGDKIPVIVWSMNKRSANDGFCATPEVDLTPNKCKIDVSRVASQFYKARVFKWL